MTILNRLRSAERMDRDLDRDIGLAIDGWSYVDMPPHGKMLYVPHEQSYYVDHPGSMYPSYTESIDAALALVQRMLPDYRVSLFTNGMGLGPCCIIMVGDEPVISNVHSPTLPLAILTALFTAFEAEENVK